MKKALALGLSVMLGTSTVSGQNLGAAELSDILNTYKDNGARFVVKYRGKSFSAQSSFAGASESIFSKGRFMGKFSVGGREINCWFEAKTDIDRLVDLNRGDQVQLSGLIVDVTMGDMELKPCSFKKL